MCNILQADRNSDRWMDLQKASVIWKMNLLRICLLISFVGSNQH